MHPKTIIWAALPALLLLSAPAFALDCYSLHFASGLPEGSDAPVSCEQWYPEGLTVCIDPEPGEQTAIYGTGFDVMADEVAYIGYTTSATYTEVAEMGMRDGVTFSRSLWISGASYIGADVLDDPYVSANFRSMQIVDGPVETLCAADVTRIDALPEGTHVHRDDPGDYPADYYPEDHQLGTPANGYLMAGVYLTSIFPRPGIRLDGGRVEYVTTYTWSPVEILVAELQNTIIGWSPHVDLELVFDEPVRVGGGAHATAYLFDWGDRDIRPAIYAETSLTGGGRGGFGQVVGGGLLFGWSPIYSLGAIARRTWTQHEDPWWTISLTLLDVRYPVGSEGERWIW